MGHRKHDANGVFVGTAHNQTALDTWVCKVRFLNTQSKELATNVIAEALYAQCDGDGNEYVLLDSIVDYQCNADVAVSCTNQVTVVDGKKMVARSTRGWELCCAWKDGSTSWQKLSDLKEPHPLQVAEFALAAGIADEPAFNWWVSWVLKRGTGLSPWSSAKALGTTSVPTNLGLSSPSRWMRLTLW